MAKPKERICIQCGKIDITCSKSKICAECFHENKREATIQRNIEELKSFGYQNPTYVGVDVQLHNVFNVINPDCGHNTEMKMLNFRSLINSTGILSCGICGPKTRWFKGGMQAYLDKYAKDYDLELHEDYRKKVTQISNQNYRTYFDIINPENLPRSQFEYHLDHIKPVILCFREGLSPEEAAAVENLQMLPYQENLSKGAKFEGVDHKDYFRKDDVLLEEI